MSMKINFNEGKKSRETIQLIILQILSDRGYTNDITFHGGTCEHFCYKNPRYSEDLDFVTTKNVNFNAISQTLQEELPKYISNKIKVVGQERDYSDNIVKKIKVRVFPDDPNKRKIEVIVEFATDIPNYTRVFANIKGGEFDFSLNAEAMEEILADKVVAFGSRAIWKSTPFKARDLWDIYWLIQNNIKLDPSMVVKKIKIIKRVTLIFLKYLKKIRDSP